MTNKQAVGVVVATTTRLMPATEHVHIGNPDATLRRRRLANVEVATLLGDVLVNIYEQSLTVDLTFSTGLRAAPRLRLRAVASGDQRLRMGVRVPMATSVVGGDVQVACRATSASVTRRLAEVVTKRSDRVANAAAVASFTNLAATVQRVDILRRLTAELTIALYGP